MTFVEGDGYTPDGAEEFRSDSELPSNEDEMSLIDQRDYLHSDAGNGHRPRFAPNGKRPGDPVPARSINSNERPSGKGFRRQLRDTYRQTPSSSNSGSIGVTDALRNTIFKRNNE